MLNKLRFNKSRIPTWAIPLIIVSYSLAVLGALLSPWLIVPAMTLGVFIIVISG